MIGIHFKVLDLPTTTHCLWWWGGGTEPQTISKSTLDYLNNEYQSDFDNSELF